MLTVKIFHNFTPRKYQIPFLQAIDKDIKRIILIWPRRHGKDKTCYNGLVKKALKRRGNYFYIFPEYSQGKKALWDNVDKDGFRTIFHAPREIIKSSNKTEMKIELVNGSTIQIVGSSNVDRIVGSNPAGVVFSEYSLIDPMVWGYILPILKENDGFAWFNFTPRGNNHAKKLYDQNKNNPDWFVQKYTALDCGVFSKEELEDTRLEYVSIYGDDDLFEQEFMTSFEAAVAGAYYGKIINRLESNGQIKLVPYFPGEPVYTAWDLGYNDTTAIWFYQKVAGEIRVIDFYEMSGESLSHYAGILQKRPYVYGKHFLPHDAKNHSIDTGQSRIQTLQKLGMKNLTILPRIKVADGIDQVRNILPICFFDENKCERGLNALREYHKEFDEKNKVWRSKPKHDWSSNAADAFRYLANSLNLIGDGSDDEDYEEDDLFEGGYY